MSRYSRNEQGTSSEAIKNRISVPMAYEWECWYLNQTPSSSKRCTLLGTSIISKLTARMLSWPSSLACSTLSTILNHPTFFKSFIATNCERLVEQYSFCTSFLKKHSIPYIHSNAGFYLWADLSAFSDRLPGSTPLEKERELNSRLMDGGLHLATSEAFWGEDCGWFRITFAVPRSVLELGLNRYVPGRWADDRMVEAIGAKQEAFQNGFARIKLTN